MLSETQSITLSQGAKTAPRFLTGTTRGRFASADGLAVIEVETKATSALRRRSIARVEDHKQAADPLTGITNRSQVGVTLIINRPLGSFTEDEVLATTKGFIAWLTAGTDANLKKIIGGEN